TLNEGNFTTSFNANLGQIENIRLRPPLPSDPVANDFKIFSIGRTSSGLRRQVLAYAVLNPMLTMKIPGALLSYTNINVNGNAKIHWGEAWSKGNMAMQSKNQYDYLTTDDKAVWRSEGLINTWGGSWQVDGLTPDVSSLIN